MYRENVFDGIIVLVLAVNETESLYRTVADLEQVLPKEDVKKILIFYPPWVTQACEAVIDELAARRFAIPVAPERQISANMAKSLMHVFRRERDNATHILFWASDGEVAQEKAALLLSAAKKDPQAFIKLSRMMKGGSQPTEKSLFLKIRDRAVCLMAHAWLKANITDALFCGHILFPLAPFNSHSLTDAKTGTIEILSLFSRLGTRFVEFPVQAMRRAEARSTVRLKLKFGIFFFLLRRGRTKSKIEG